MRGVSFDVKTYLSAVESYISGSRTVEGIVERTGTSEPTFYNKLREYREKGGRIDPPRMRGSELKRTTKFNDALKKLKKQHPDYGRDRLRRELAKEGHAVSGRTVGRALTELDLQLPPKGGLCEAEVEWRPTTDEEEGLALRDCDLYSGKAGAALTIPLWCGSGYARAFSILGEEHQRNALAFAAASALGYRAYNIPALNLPTMSIVVAGAPSTIATTSAYSTLKEIGKHSEEILSRMPEVDAKKVAVDIHAMPKFCEGLDMHYTPHKSSPCTCRAVEVVAEISEKGIARPLSIEPVPARGNAITAGAKVAAADELKRITSFLEEKAGRKVPLEADAEYTRSRDSLASLMSSGWRFTTRTRSDSILGREVKEKMLSEGLKVYGKWYSSEEYGGRFQIVGRRIQRDGEKEPVILLHLSTKRLSPEEVIEERRHRWRIENLFKNVDMDCTPGNDDDELKGYYTLAFFMAEMGRAFKASTKTVGLIMDREGRVTVKDGVMKLRLQGSQSKSRPFA